MDRNTITGLFLIFLILLVFGYMNQPSPEEIEQQQRQQDSIALVQQQQDSAKAAAQGEVVTRPLSNDSIRAVDTVQTAQNTNIDSTLRTNQFGIFAPFANGKEELVTLENDRIKLTLSTAGGRIASVELKKYKRHDQSALILFEDNQFSYGFNTTEGKAIQTQDLYFTSDVQQAVATEKQAASATMLIRLSSDKYIEQTYTLPLNSDLADYSLQLKGFENIIPGNTNYLDLQWAAQLPKQEQSRKNEDRTSGLYYRFTDDEVENLSESSDDEEVLKNATIQWVSYKQQFFNSALIAERPFESGKVSSTVAPEESDMVKAMQSSLTLGFNHKNSETYNMRFYFGPNHYKTLKALDIQLEKVVPLGWGIFGWVNKYLVINIFNFLNQYFVSYGLIIFLMTLIIKLLLFPLVYRSHVSMVKMRLVKPEMDELREKYGKDMQKMQQESMKLYKKAGVNPLGGCIPLLLQMPILIAMFTFFPSSFELRQESFLWAKDLSTYDSIWTFGYVPIINSIYGDHVSLFTLLMTISTLIYTRMNNQLTGASGQMKWIGYVMPIVFLGVFNNYSAALSYYYFLSNIITFSQQFLIRQFVDEKKLHKKLQENKKKPGSQKKSKFQKRLEEMARKRGIDPEKMR